MYAMAGADPENLHGRWLTGWLPIVNHTGARGWQTIPVLLWSTTTTVLSLESLLTHRQDSFKGMHMGLGLVSLNIMSLKKLGMYAMAQSINMFSTMVAAFSHLGYAVYPKLYLC